MSEKIIITSNEFDNPEAIEKFQAKLREKVKELQTQKYIEKILTAKNPDEVHEFLDEAIKKIGMFQELSPKKEAEFRKWGQENDPVPNQNWFVIHPIIRDEWIKRGFRPIP